MSRERFAFALAHSKPSHWELFENLSSAFLAAEFPGLRTVATSSGDKGRDAELFSWEGNPTVMIQYSVAVEWNSKINDTVNTITNNFLDVRVLIYLTNQKIGAKSDDLSIKLRNEKNIILDIRDCEWYLDRYAIDPDREKVAEDYSRIIVDPILSDNKLIRRHVVGLSNDEARCALLFLQLQWEDDTRDKGLTKLCFDALVKAVLRGTDSDSRIPRSEIIRKVQQILFSHDEKHIKVLTNSAINRLSKNIIRHWVKEDEFCLSHEESQRVSEKLIDISNQDQYLYISIEKIIIRNIARDCDPFIIKEGVNFIRKIIEKTLLKRGELFAAAINKGNFESLDLSGIREVAIVETNQASAALTKLLNLNLTIEICIELLADPEPEIMISLRRLADAYTLMAFLRETPDVQSSINKMFSSGEIWLDTTIILPLMAEELVIDKTIPFTNMIKAAREAGIDLFVTGGVVEEACAHINICFAYHYHTGVWRGKVPFLYAAQAIIGSGPSNFQSWITKFTGPTNPQEDLAEYLEDYFGIKIQSLEEEVKNANSDERGTIKEQWLEIHESRRKQVLGEGIDQHLAIRLAEHDTENYLGVLQRRQQKVGASPFGYRSWWLTLDVEARSFFRRVKDLKMSDPVLSPDFLLNYLAFGPLRSRISKNSEASLPLILEGIILGDTPKELMDIVEKIRESKASLPERLIRREIRDAIIKARRREGRIAKGGMSEIEKNFGIKML